MTDGDSKNSSYLAELIALIHTLPIIELEEVYKRGKMSSFSKESIFNGTVFGPYFTRIKSDLDLKTQTYMDRGDPIDPNIPLANFFIFYNIEMILELRTSNNCNESYAPYRGELEDRAFEDKMKLLDDFLSDEMEANKRIIKK